MRIKKNKKEKQFNSSLNYIFITICFVAICLGYFLGTLFNGESSISASAIYSAIMKATSPNATSPNATSSNATNHNATNHNATSSNATNHNATNHNATNQNATNPNTSMKCNSDNILMINSLTYVETNIIAGNNVPVGIVLGGSRYNGGSFSFVGVSNNSTFTAKLETNDSIGHYFTIPANLASGTYRLNELVINAVNCDGSSFAKHFTYADNHDEAPTAFDTIITVTNNTAETISLSELALTTTKAKVGESVYLSVKTTPTLKSLKLKLVDGAGKVLNVQVKSLAKNPYFDIPSTTDASTYTLVNAILETANATAIYDLNGADGANPFPFNSTLTVEASDSDVYIYNNEDINNNVIKQLYKTKDKVTIIVNANSSTIINSELFNVIKGTDKKLVINNNDNQFVFDGNDITNPKAIDVNIDVDGDNTSIYKLVDDCVIIRFADNGELPGKALIRIKSTDEIDSLITDDKAYVYVYNEGSKDFCEVGKNISKTRAGYYEFSVTHNSDYIIVNEKLKNDLVVASDDVVTFQKSNMIYLLLICVGGIVIIVLVLVLMNLKKKEAADAKKETSKDEKTDEKKEEKKESSKEEVKKEDK